MSIVPTLQSPALLQLAFTHRSALNEDSSLVESNERLEFLGDAVLELVVTEYLYKQLPAEQEGKLTSLRAALVKTTTLAELARSLGFDQLLKISKGEEMSGSLKNDTIMADTFEAFVGALYLDQDKEAVERFLVQHLFPLLENIQKHNLDKDAKSLLQEYLQSQNKRPPEYLILRESGPAHRRRFQVGVRVSGEILGRGEGKTKQDAQQEAAAEALEFLQASASISVSTSSSSSTDASVETLATAPDQLE